jgi:hypothetical protein
MPVIDDKSLPQQNHLAFIFGNSESTWISIGEKERLLALEREVRSLKEATSCVPLDQTLVVGTVLNRLFDLL